MRTGEDAIGLLNLPYKGRCGPSTMPVASLTRVATSAAVMMTTMIEDIAIVGERMMTITTAASDGGITIVDRAIATTAETAIGAARRMTTALNGASAIGETGATRSLRRRPPIETLVDRRAMLSRRGHRHRRRPRQSRPRLLRRVKAHSVCTVNYKHIDLYSQNYTHAFTSLKAHNHRIPIFSTSTGAYLGFGWPCESVSSPSVSQRSSCG